MVHCAALAIPLTFICLLLLPACASSSAPPAVPSTPAAATSAPPPTSAATLLPAVSTSLASYEAGVDAIPPERKEHLERLVAFVRSKRSAGDTARLLFICTHNSRRSHMGQAWAAAAAAYYGIDHVDAFSGGIEVTAFNPRAMAALERAGFQLANPGGDNPHVKITYATNRPPLEAFSKKYTDPFNPKENFAAIMTCSHADAECPVVLGASARVAIPYDDPKSSDGTPEETATYDARSRQIASEMLFLFSRVKLDSDHRVSGL
jgi:arsenate reductase